MRRRTRPGSSAPVILLATLTMVVGCGAEPGILPVVDPKIPPIRLTSTAFSDEQLIPIDYTCDGKNLSPPLSWTDVPPEARSLVLLCDDPDAPLRTWSHWVVFNISPGLTGFKDGIADVESLTLEGGHSARQGKNDLGDIGYGGPCPPQGTHRYFFRIYALDTVLNPERGALRSTVLKAMEDHVLAEGILVGKYARSSR